jgi:hypothetical protein
MKRSFRWSRSTVAEATDEGAANSRRSARTLDRRRGFARMLSSYFPLSLYHGTSTLFLADILAHGLGGRDPLNDLRLHEFIREADPLIKSHLAGTDTYEVRSHSWDRMVNQASGGWNFQHGQTYVSASLDVAARYAANNWWGSELLTYAMDFLQLLVDRDVSGVRTDLFRRFPRIFHLLESRPAPLLIRIDEVPERDLLSEHGGPPDEDIAAIRQAIAGTPALLGFIRQRANFRLQSPIHPKQLRAWVMATTGRNCIAPKYDLYELSLKLGQSAT